MLRSEECARAPLGMFDPVPCVIVAQGALECSWSERLGGLAITVHETDGGPRTILAGMLPDQAAVHGVLMALYDLGLPVLSVTSA